MFFNNHPLFIKFKNFFSLTSWLVLALSFFLTGIVAIAQTSIPGDPGYPIKIGFEKAVLAGFKLFNLDARYQIDLTELRFIETKKIIKSKNSVLGFSTLLKQILTTENSIYKVKDPQKRVVLAKQYIKKLTDINYQLELIKTPITTQPLISPSKLTVRLPPTLIPTIASQIQTLPQSDYSQIQPTSPPQIEELPQSIINEQITTTQKIIEETIEHLEDVANNTPPVAEPSPSPSPSSQPNRQFFQHSEPEEEPTNIQINNLPSSTPSPQPTEDKDSQLDEGIIEFNIQDISPTTTSTDYGDYPKNP